MSTNCPSTGLCLLFVVYRCTKVHDVSPGAAQWSQLTVLVSSLLGVTWKYHPSPSPWWLKSKVARSLLCNDACFTMSPEFKCEDNICWVMTLERTSHEQWEPWKSNTRKSNSKPLSVPHGVIHFCTKVSLIFAEYATKDRNQPVPVMRISAFFWEQSPFVHTSLPPLLDSAVLDFALVDLKGWKTHKKHEHSAVCSDYLYAID